MYKYHVFVHSSVSGHLGYFHVLAIYKYFKIVKTTQIVIWVQSSLCFFRLVSKVLFLEGEIFFYVSEIQLVSRTNPLLHLGKLYFTLRFWIIQTSQRLRQHSHVERVRQTWVEILDPLLTVTLDAVFILSEPFFFHL